ncbi:MAG: carbon-nitrogen hydrolase family protein [Actinomycetota bacterium]
MKIRVAAVQPRSHHGPEEERNVERALSWMERAAGEGAELVVFPEGYPGPTNPANDYDSLGPLAERAASLGLHVVAGRIEPITGANGHHVCLSLIDDTGAVASTYRRTSPVGPYVYKDLDVWQVDYVEGPEPPQVVNTRLGRIGMLVCSEVYVPELSRLLALQGADLIVYPAGGAINELLATWRTLLWARAIENLVFTVASQNLYAPDEQGVGQIAAPERILAASPTEGLLVADLDLDRLEYLRGQDERIEFPKPYDAIPGVTRWRRPELYAGLTEAGAAHAPASAS